MLNGPLSSSRYSAFTLSLRLTIAVFLALCVAFGCYVWFEKSIDRANEARFRSHQLADELRLSSDNLTRMVRTYLATSEPIYKRHYQEIVDIRDGRLPRPNDYQEIYWELVLADDRRPRSSAAAIPLLELMREAGFKPAEFALLQQAKVESDLLTQTEQAAIALLESRQPVPDAIRIEALRMVTDDEYHAAKARIMDPINRFNAMVERRTLAEVQQAQRNALWLLGCILLLGGLLVVLLRQVWLSLSRTLGSSPDELYASIARIGRGDFSMPVTVPPGMRNSVLDWLAQTQRSLLQLDNDRRQAESRNRRLNQLYLALSECSQAVLISSDENELFARVCRAAVEQGGLRMVWVGLIDTDGWLQPAASYGEGTEYLQGIRISVDPESIHGQGPSGIACRENRPYWCQDYLQDPATAAWREKGQRFGWRASAALPLQLEGTVVGTFNLYAGEPGVFDEPTRNLLAEMVLIFVNALGGFRLEARHRQLEQALVDSEERARLVLENSLDAVINIGEDGLVLEWNTAASTIFGYAREEAVGHDLADLIIPEHYRDGHRSAIRRLKGQDSSRMAGKRLELEALHKDGRLFPVEISFTLVQGQHQGGRFYSAFLRDISERKLAEERIQYLALYDALTGLPNRVQLEERFHYAMSLAKRNEGHIAVMFLDLDHFKNINDTLGHNVGDLLLVEVAARLKRILREQDTVARLGGDEFILLIPEGREDGIRRVAEKILAMIAEPFVQDNGSELNVSASIGITFYPDDGNDFATLLKNADSAMYRAKHEGRNGYSFFTAQMQARSARNLELENALRHALALGQLALDYQPQISVADGRLVGAEALLRWRHPVLASISPAEFVPIAEETGLILPIGEWVLRSALTQLRAWIDAGLEPFIVAVNISAVQFRHPSLPDLVTGLLDELQLPPEYLELELTEGIAMHDPQSAIAIMNKLHERGIRMSIDDFGTGYSSLSYLKKFNVYKLKIDQSFVRDISTDPEDKAIVIAIINMASSLGLKTIAEGVETAAQLAFVTDQGCDEVQGYYFSKPLSPDLFAQFACASMATLQSRA